MLRIVSGIGILLLLPGILYIFHYFKRFLPIAIFVKIYKTFSTLIVV